MSKKPLSVAAMRKLVSRLGKEKDIDLAAEFGITRQRVSEIRKQRHIAAYKPEPAMPYPWPVHFTKADKNNIKRAMKKVSEGNRSRYIRGAVRIRNKGVLGK